MSIAGMTKLSVVAASVQEGDFLPGLDNGYCFRDAETGPYVVAPYAGIFGSARPDDTVSIAFHDADGDENEILCKGAMRLTIECPNPERHDHSNHRADDED